MLDNETSPLAARFAQLAQDCGTQPAITFRGDERKPDSTFAYDFGKFWRRVQRVTAHLQATWGVQAGDRIGLMAYNHPATVVLLIACARVGAILVPCNPEFEAREAQYIFEHAGVRGVICSTEALSKVQEATCLMSPAPWQVVIEQDQPDGEMSLLLQWQCSPPDLLTRTGTADSTCMIIYTSGTTGFPKGVMHSFGNLAWAINAGLQRVPMAGEDRMLSYLPLAHVVERVLVEHGWLQTGMSLYFAESLDTFAADLQRARPTIFFSVPRLWVKFQQGVQAKMPPAKLNRLLKIPILNNIVRKKVLSALGLDQCIFAAGGAAPMPAELLAWYAKLGLNINEGYGMTENLALSHITEPGKNQQGTVGPVYEGVEHRIDPATGEVQMRSQALMQGYYKEPEKTAEVFTPDGWLKTGDKGQIDGQAKNAQVGGDGGFAEVSGKQELAYSGRADARAAKGTTGDLLLDPSTLEIRGGGSGSGSLPNADGVIQLDASCMHGPRKRAGAVAGSSLVDT